MALSLINSWGGTNDNIYASVADADEYIGSDTVVGYKQSPAIWTVLNSIQKGRALLAATRDIDGASNYIGAREFVDQSLEFPRLPSGSDQWPWTNRALTTVNTFNIYLTEQKRRVKAACVEQAYALVRDSERDTHLERQLRGIRSYSESTGPVSESATYGGTILSLVPESMELLMPYIGFPELVRG